MKYFILIENQPKASIPLGDIDEENQRTVWIKANTASQGAMYLAKYYPGINQAKGLQEYRTRRPITWSDGLDVDVLGNRVRIEDQTQSP